jgi:hypothetical protein
MAGRDGIDLANFAFSSHPSIIQPELLARHYTEAGLASKAVGLWGKAGLRSLERCASVEAVEQLRRALDQIERLSADPVSRRDRLRLQVAIIAPLIHVKPSIATVATAGGEPLSFMAQANCLPIDRIKTCPTQASSRQRRIAACAVSKH